MNVREVLKAKGSRIVVIGPEATADEAIARMVEENIGSLPVVDAENQLVGVISERDLIREMHDRGEGFRGCPIREIMTLDPVTCGIDDEVDVVMGQMTERRVAKIPVIERGAMVGIISVGDVVKLLYERTLDENHHLMDYLHGPIHA